MDSPDIFSCNSHTTSQSNELENPINIPKPEIDEFANLQEQVIANFQKPNLPNVCVPEKIIICLDICHDEDSSLFHLSDGTTFTPINMLKRVLDFFFITKQAINKRTEFALLLLKDNEPRWVQGFTNNLKDIFNNIDCIISEFSRAETFDFKNIFEILKQKVEIPEYKQGECILPPPYVVRMIVLYGRSDCVPLISPEDSNFIFLKKQFYFYVDILFVHEDQCQIHKCAEIFDALQHLDSGYSYVYEVSRNPTKIHICTAKLLAHPLQRPLQKNCDYIFGLRLDKQC